MFLQAPSEIHLGRGLLTQQINAILARIITGIITAPIQNIKTNSLYILICTSILFPFS